MTDLREAGITDKGHLSETVTVDSTITAALLSAGAIAAAEAGENAWRLITRTGSAVNQAGVIANTSYLVMKRCFVAEPASGAFFSSPPLELESVPGPELAFTLWQNSDDSPASVKSIAYKDLTLPLAELMATWIADTLGPKLESAASYVMRSRGAGVEGVVIYELPAGVGQGSVLSEPLYVVLYLNNPKIGSVEAGGFITSKTEFDKNYDIKEDEELEKVIDHIQDNDLYSSGESKKSNYKPSPKSGSTEYVYCLKYQAAEITTFDLTREQA